VTEIPAGRQRSITDLPEKAWGCLAAAMGFAQMGSKDSCGLQDLHSAPTAWPDQQESRTLLINITAPSVSPRKQKRKQG
jgi:hypothetical protein